MESKKPIGLIVILIFIILGLGGSIVYDKIFLPMQEENNETVEEEENGSKTNTGNNWTKWFNF